MLFPRHFPSKGRCSQESEREGDSRRHAPKRFWSGAQERNARLGASNQWAKCYCVLWARGAEAGHVSGGGLMGGSRKPRPALRIPSTCRPRSLRAQERFVDQGAVRHATARLEKQSIRKRTPRVRTMNRGVPCGTPTGRSVRASPARISGKEQAPSTHPSSGADRPRGM